MIKLGVIGYPLTHTLSPPMHNEAFRALGIEGNYIALEIKPEELKHRISDLVSKGYRGFNVTIPFKIDVMKYLNIITEEAKAVGAVNTVIIDGSKRTTGDNTDVYGFKAAFNEIDLEHLKNKKAVIIGSGGAARAVGAALIQMQLNQIDIYSRKLDNANNTAVVLADYAEGDMTITANTTENIDLSDTDLLVNASPVGMHPNKNNCPLKESLLGPINPDGIVYDLIYRPQKTKLLQLAEAKGLKIYGGTEMLVMQGAKAFEKWTHQKAPVDNMRKILLQTLNNE